jgi:hypothetical protein
MNRFVGGVDRWQATLFPECLEDWIDEDNPVRVIDVFVEKLDFAQCRPRSQQPASRYSNRGLANTMVGHIGVRQCERRTSDRGEPTAP